MNTMGKKMFAALAGLLILMGAECKEEKEYTCEQVTGVGYHKVTVYKCKGSKVEILGGKLYIKEKGKCHTEVKEFWGAYEYWRYTGKSGRSFNVPLGELVEIGGAAAGVPTGALPD